MDINSYLGLWYEIARIDHSFRKNCVASTAEYSTDLTVISGLSISAGRKMSKEIWL